MTRLLLSLSLRVLTIDDETGPGGGSASVVEDHARVLSLVLGVHLGDAESQGVTDPSLTELGRVGQHLRDGDGVRVRARVRV